MSDEVTPMYPTLFSQVQDYVVERLNSDYQLSAVGLEFIPEHIRDVEYLIKRNLGKQGMVGIVNTVKAQYGGHDGETQCWQMEVECDILENPPIRQAWMKKNDISAGTVVDCCNFVNESLAGPYSPTYGQFCSKSVEVGEDSGIVVGKCLFDTYALGEISGAVSGESHYVIKWATKDELSALSAETWNAIYDLSAELSGSEEVWNAIEELSSDVSSISSNVSNLADRVDSVEQQIEDLDDLAVKYTDDDKYLVVLNPRPTWTTSLRINDGSAIGNSQIQFGSGQGSYRNYITRNRMVLGLPEDNETPEDVGDTQIQFGGVHNNADLILGSGIHIISSTEKGKSQILMDEQRLYVVTPEEVSAGQTLKAVQVYDDPPLNAMSMRDMKSREEPRWHWEYHSANLPDKTSDLTNDSGYVTSSEVSAEISSISQDVGSISQDVQDLSAWTGETFSQIGSDISALSAWNATQDSLISELSTQTISNSTDLSALSVEIQEVSANMSKSIVRRWEEVRGLTFTGGSGGGTVSMQAFGSAPDVSLEYNTGDGWRDFVVGETSVVLEENQSMMMRAKTSIPTLATSTSDYNKFVMAGEISASDSIMYLLEPDASLSAKYDVYYGKLAPMANFAFCKLFSSCSALVTAPELPAQVVSNSGYMDMFYNTSLKTPPSMPATWYGAWGCASMFRDCRQLTSAPELSTTGYNLEAGKFYQMFSGCSSLVYVPDLSADGGYSSYGWMFANCTSLVKAPELPAVTGLFVCDSMFYNCTSLTTPPSILPAEHPGWRGYGYMFGNCTSLSAAPELPSSDTGEKEVYLGMFKNCKSLTKSPLLHYDGRTENFGKGLYQEMFYGCSSLNEIRTEWTLGFGGTASTSNVFKDWVRGVSASGTFYYDGEDTTTGNSAIPTGWTVQPLTPPVDYLQYINTNRATFSTGYVPTETTRIHLEVSGNDLGDATIGFHDNDSSDYRIFNGQDNGENLTRLYFDCGSDRIITANNSYTLNGWNTIDAANYEISCTPEGGSTYTAQGTPQQSSQWDQSPMMIGANRYLNVRRVKIYEGDTLVKDYRPARDPDGTVCLYEEVSQTYQYPSSGDFVDGTTFVPALTFKAVEANSSVTISNSGSFQYSVDGGTTWNPYVLGTSISLSSIGDSVLVRGSNGYQSGNTNLSSTRIQGTGKWSCTGSLLYLLNSDGLPPRESSIESNCFYGMFQNNTSITTCPEFPIDELPYECCREMFQGCTNMTGPVKWNNIVTVDQDALVQAFYNTGITSVEMKSISTMGGGGFNNCFYGCSNLVSADIRNLTSINGAYGMGEAFQDCPLLRTVLMNKFSYDQFGIYGSWKNDTSLEVVDFSEATAVLGLYLGDGDLPFDNTNDTYKVVVPDNLYSSWISANGWSSIASHIIKKSDYDTL